MPVTRSDISCGVYLLWGLSERPADNLYAVAWAYRRQALSQHRRNGFAQIAFSDNDYMGRGIVLADYIRKQFPRSVLTEALAKRSPSTGNTIRTWVWSIPHSAFKKHHTYLRVLK